MSKVQFNPGTLKVSYNNGTDKVQVVTPIAPCSFCSPDSTPETVSCTLSSFVPCDGCRSIHVNCTEVPESANYVKFNFGINTLYTLVRSDTCLWTYTIVNGITVSFYSDSGCISLVDESDYDINLSLEKLSDGRVAFLAIGPYFGAICRAHIGTSFYTPDSGKCLDVTSENVFNLDNCPDPFYSVASETIVPYEGYQDIVGYITVAE